MTKTIAASPVQVQRPGDVQRRLIDEDGLRAAGIRMSRVTFWRLARAGRFPRPILVGSKNHWVLDEVEAWLEEKIRERDHQAVAGAGARDAQPAAVGR